MEITTLIVLIILGIILYKAQPMLANIFFLLAGLFSFSGITLNTIQEITGTTITYITVDPWISYAISFIFIALALINYIELFDYGRKQNEAKKRADYSQP